MRTHIIYICRSAKLLLCCLFGLLPILASGQTSSPISPKEGVGWWEAFNHGGYVRTRDPYTGRRIGPLYMKVGSGISSLLTVNYVDGYTLGPSATWGYVSKDGWRLELDEEVRWAFSRDELVAYGALRYILPVEQQSRFSLFGGRITRSFDPDPMMPNEHTFMAAGLFGWDKQKYYLLTHVGVRAEVSLAAGLSVDAAVQWRKTEQMVNHRRRNLFGAKSQDNIPIVNGSPYAGKVEDTSFRPLLDVALSWQAGQTLFVRNDLESYIESLYPRLTLRAIAALPDDNLSLETRIEQTYSGLSYMASAGWFPLHNEVALYDYHHFDATRFPWMRDYRLSWFSLLDEYELSTDRSWMEMHVEYCHRDFLLSRFVRNPRFRDFIQVHEAVVCSHSHTEFSYGWAIGPSFRLGFSLGWDKASYDGIAFNLIYGL